MTDETATTIDGRLVLDDRIVSGRIAIAGGHISAVTLDEAAMDGPVLSPGFVDVHVHGWVGTTRWATVPRWTAWLATCCGAA